MTLKNLLIMAVVHFTAMYFLMFAMVEKTEDIFLNLNNLYMAGLMTAPMLMMEIIMAHSIYGNKLALLEILTASIVLFSLFFFFVRQQVAINDEEFLRSMIPHHSGALLMCKRSNIRDPEIKRLCNNIVKSQQSEIDLMKKIQDRLK